MTSISVKSEWKSTGGYHGREVPVPPEGWRTLCACSVVNEAGEQARAILASWLKKNKIRYRSGYLSTSNVFSANLYFVIEETDKVSDDLASQIDEWFVTVCTSTFSCMTGDSWELDVAEARETFDAVVAGGRAPHRLDRTSARRYNVA